MDFKAASAGMTRLYEKIEHEEPRLGEIDRFKENKISLADYAHC